MSLKTTFKATKINCSCWYFQPYGPNFFRFRDQNAEGEQAEIANSFINFITANMRQKTDLNPLMVWVQARQINRSWIEFFFSSDITWTKRKGKTQILLFLTPFSPYPGITPHLDGNDWIWINARKETSLAPYWVAWIDCNWSCWNTPVFFTLESDFFPLRHCGKYTYGPVGVQSNSRKRNENNIIVIYREDPDESGVTSSTESLSCIFFTSLL